MSTATWDSPDLERTRSNGDDEAAIARGKISTLKELTSRLFREMQSVREVNAITVENGVDFYDEVRRFEIDLIKRALLQTGGHQGRAAKLLHLKVTTLNSKIKHYNINLTGFTHSYSLLERKDGDNSQHA
jgi:transcriptional regulator with GAF, ATPase, and Fis domain